MTTITLQGDFEHDADTRSFLQMIRTWERDHQHVQIAIKMESPDHTARQAEEIFNDLHPGFPYRLIVPTKDE